MPILLSFVAFLMSQSMTMRRIVGDSRHPWRTPVCTILDGKGGGGGGGRGVGVYAKEFGRRWDSWQGADNYKDLRETIVNQDGDPRNVGQKVLLPATFCGGPHYMFERQQDAMAYVRKLGRPDLILTVTTNPKWPDSKIAAP